MEHIRLQEKLKAVESKIIVGGVNLVSKPAMTLSLPHFIFNPLTPKIQRSFLLTVCYTFFYNCGTENSISNQTISISWCFFYLPNIFLQDNRLTLYGEITNWSLLGVKVLNVDCYYLNDMVPQLPYLYFLYRRWRFPRLQH